MRFNFAITIALLCLPCAAFAQDENSDGLPGATSFSGLRGSIAFDGTISGHAATTPPTTIKANTDVGGGGSVYWGWRLGYGFKTELELLYRDQSLSTGTFNGTSGKIGGYTETFAPMVNAYWTIPVGDIGFHPFVGGGVGYGWNETGINDLGGVSFPTLHNDNWKVAYNAMAGLSYPMSSNSRVTGMYRWFHQDIGVNCGGIACGANFNVSSFDIGIEMDL